MLTRLILLVALAWMAAGCEKTIHEAAIPRPAGGEQTELAQAPAR